MEEGGARNAPEKQDIQFIEHFLAGKGGADRCAWRG